MICKNAECYFHIYCPRCVYQDLSASQEPCDDILDVCEFFEGISEYYREYTDYLRNNYAHRLERLWHM